MAHNRKVRYGLLFVGFVLPSSADERTHLTLEPAFRVNKEVSKSRQPLTHHLAYLRSASLTALLPTSYLTCILITLLPCPYVFSRRKLSIWHRKVLTASRVATKKQMRNKVLCLRIQRHMPISHLFSIP